MSMIENHTGEPEETGKAVWTPIGNKLCDSQYSLEDRAVGVILVGMIGDALGAAVEGCPASLIRRSFPQGVRKYYSAKHMGLDHLPPRYAMYTDDTQSLLALAHSIVQNNALIGEKVAMSYADFYTHTPLRGYPNSAIQLLTNLKNGKLHYTTSGTSLFPDGSYANGGAMRISPIGIVFRDAEDSILKGAVITAIKATHVHPQSIEGSYLQAKAVSLLLSQTADSFNVEDFLTSMLSFCSNDDYKVRLSTILASYKSIPIELNLDDEEACSREYTAQKPILRKIIDSEFQLSAIDAITIVFWAFSLYWMSPAVAISKIISYGGDTDTIASILGCLLGALHGTHWIPSIWYNPLEDGVWGKSFAIQTAKTIAQLSLTNYVE